MLKGLFYSLILNDFLDLTYLLLMLKGSGKTFYCFCSFFRHGNLSLSINCFRISLHFRDLPILCQRSDALCCEANCKQARALKKCLDLFNNLMLPEGWCLI